MKEIIYARTSVLRKPEFRVTTTIVLDNNVIQVVKKPTTKDATRHLGKLEENYNEISSSGLPFVAIKPDYVSKDKIVFKYVAGIRLDKYVFDSAINDRVDHIIEALDTIIKAIESVSVKKSSKQTEKFSKIFGSVFSKEKDWVKLGYFDYNLDNFIIDESNEITLIDYEWLFDFKIPKNYIISRIFYYLIPQLTPIYKTKASTKCPVIGIGDFGYVHEEIYEKYKNYIKYLPKTHMAEANLQNYVNILPTTTPHIDFYTYSRHERPIFPSLINRLESAESTVDDFKKDLENHKKSIESLQVEIDNRMNELNIIKNSKTWRLRSKIRKN